MIRKEEILADCLEQVRQGRSTVEDCLRRYPELVNELKSLLELSSNIRPVNVTPTPEFRRRLQNQLFDEPKPVTGTGGEGKPGLFIFQLPVKAVTAGLLAFVILAGGAGSAYASQSSLPGDLLYPVKIGMENIQVAITRDPEEKAYLYLKIAERRINEIAAGVSLSRTPAASALAAVPEKTDAALREIGKAAPNRADAFLARFAAAVTNQQIVLGAILNTGNENVDAVKQTMTSLQRASLIADTAYNNTAFLGTGPSVRDDLEKGRFQVEGTLLSVTGKTWNVGGVILTNVRFNGELPVVSSQLKIDAINKNGEVYIIDLAVKDIIPSTVKIQGPFNGTDKTGKVWYVGDTPIQAPEGKMPPAQGRNLEVKGVTNNSSMNIEDIQEKEDEVKSKGQSARLEGKLDSVDVENKTITIKVAGSGFTLVISSAKITDNKGKQVDIPELVKVSGKRVQIDGIARKDGKVYAEQVRIDAD